MNSEGKGNQMEFNYEILEKAREAVSFEAYLALTKEEGYEILEEDAKSYFEFLHKEGECSDEELNQAAGGWGEKPKPWGEKPKPKYFVGTRIKMYWPTSKTYTHGTIKRIDDYIPGRGYMYLMYVEEYKYEEFYCLDTWEPAPQVCQDFRPLPIR